MLQTADIALIGLAVMGQNIVLNMNDHGFTVAVFNRTTSKVDEFLANEAKGTKVIGAHSLEELVGHLKRPRRIMLLVKAGKPVDEFIDALVPLLEPGDIIIDGGNSFYEDTVRRYEALKQKGILFVGSGVSGGEEGARHGPSLMPGGAPEAWPHIRAIFQSIAAKVDRNVPLLRLGSAKAARATSSRWSTTASRRRHAAHLRGLRAHGPRPRPRQPEAGRNLHHLEPGRTRLVSHRDHLEDFRLQGHRRQLPHRPHPRRRRPERHRQVDRHVRPWDQGAPITLIAEAVFARMISSYKEERVAASKILVGPEDPKFTGDVTQTLEDIRLALYASKIVSYTQGYMLMRRASDAYKWKLNYGGLALMWRGGCIIRSRFLGDIKAAFDRNPNLNNLMLDDFFNEALKRAQAGWRRTVALGAQLGIATPTFSNALSFYDSYRSARLPANLLQAQRDYFGAHTYERTDKPRGQFFHSNWTGEGGTTSSTSYNA